MSTEQNEFLNFNAYHIISIELKPNVASNCKLRSSYVHEKLIETKNNLSGNPLLLKLSNKGIKIFNPDSQVLLTSHSIHRISYTACDRSSCQFAMVARSTENGNAQFCHILRLCSAEEADTINRYIGSLFKDLNQKRKSRKSECLSKNAELPPHPVLSEESAPAVINPINCESDVHIRIPNHIYDDLDTRLRRISTPHIDELVSEKHYVRRLSLCMPSPSSEEQGISQGPPNLHSSLEKKSNNSNCIALPIENKPLLRKKSDYKPNKISAVIERLSFRASRDLSTDLLKSGSPVVALKEQLESFDRYGDKNVACPIKDSRNSIANFQPKKRFPLANDTTNNLKSSALPRKNSAPIPLEQVANSNVNIDEEQPPVPPVRIHSLRNPVLSRPIVLMDESPLVRYRGDCSVACNNVTMATDQDDHLSSITTPSSCGDNTNQIDFHIEDPRQLAGIDLLNKTGKSIRGPATSGAGVTASTSKMNASTSFSNNINNQYRPPSNQFDNFSTKSQINQYFRNITKDETNEYLIKRELGSFILRNSASHQECFALSVKTSDINVSHYIIQSSSVGFQIKGLDKMWPSLYSLITHLSVIPEMLPCPLSMQQTGPDRKPSNPTALPDAHAPDHSQSQPGANPLKKQSLPQSKSANEEYQLRMRQFLNDSSSMPGQEQYQQLSDFSSMIASFDVN